jgi:hypothetical protein
MPIVTLTFNLPEESEEAQVAQDGQKWKSAMWNFRQALRDKYKYQCQKTFTADEILELIKEAHKDQGLEME